MATPLSNADFRALMSESRQGGSEKKRRGHKPGENRHRPKKKDSKADAAEEADEPTYRDRAKERRDLGFDQDYKEVMADIRAAENTFSKDETQFLGGDLLRTHLVKGLDRALLHKTRTQLDKQPAQVKPAPAPAIKEAPSAGVAATEAARKEPGKRRFTTPLGRAVYQAVFNPPQSRLKVAEMFLPRRMAFRYGGDDDDGDDGGGGNQWGQYNIPTVIRRAAADCPRVQETMLAAVDGDVLEKMSKLMTYLKTASGKKSKRTDRRKILEEYGILQSGAAAAARVLGSGSAAAGGRGEGGDQGRQDGAAAAKQPAVQPTQQLEEEDIFGDAGTDYTVTVAERDRTAAPPPPPPPVHDGSYFDTADDMADLPPVAQSQPGASGAAAPASRTAVARPSQRTKEGEAGKKSIIPFEGDDAYNECFPSTFGMGREAYDSDDEKPGTEQPGADAAQKPRSEFASDEDYKRYLGQKGPEATDAKKRMNRETQKLNNQLHRIERIFKDKGRGTSAFRAPPDAEGGARQGGDGGGGGEQPSRAPAKRRRILG